MGVLFVDVAGDSDAATAASTWSRATGVATRAITLSDGAVGFVRALAPVTAVDGTRPACRIDGSGTVYAAVADLDGWGETARVLASGASRLVLATGTVEARPDGGAGLLAELAVLGGLDGERAVARIEDVDGAADLLAAARDAAAGTAIVAAVDTEAPLLGLNGVAATGEWPGGVAESQGIEDRLGRFADLMYRAADRLGPTRLMAAPRPATLPGAGSGGGLGHAIALLDGTLRPALGVVADALDLAGEVAGADLVVARVSTLGAREMGGGVVPVLTGLAASVAVPVVVVTDRSLVGRREWSADGVAAVYETDSTTIERVARTWSRIG